MTTSPLIGRRQLLSSAVVSALSLALGVSAAVTSSIEAEGTDYERALVAEAGDILRRAGWLPYVSNNVALVKFVIGSAAEMQRNTHGPRCTVYVPDVMALPSAEGLASLLVHESAHQSLYNHGLGYESPQWAEFPYDGHVRPWQLQEFTASCVEQAFRECAGLLGDVYRRPESLA